jgi:hypothetical protein
MEYEGGVVGVVIRVRWALDEAVGGNETGCIVGKGFIGGRDAEGSALAATESD